MYIGVNKNSGMTHSLPTITAKYHDGMGMKTVLREKECSVFTAYRCYIAQLKRCMTA